MQKISVLGCGWLGFPLAKKLAESGFIVNGSTTTSEKMSKLEDIGIIPFMISLTEEGIRGKIDEFLKDSEVLIINIPPKLRTTSSDNFVAKMERLIPFIQQSSVQKVLFVSSTSVYGNQDGVITEEIVPEPNTESGKQLLQTEKLLQRNSSFKTTILRFGGLIGEDRHPVKHLAGKENLESPDASINLIHQKDCIDIILKIIDYKGFVDIWGETFNAVAPFHPTRKEYYSQKATEMNLPIPLFKESNFLRDKIISYDKISNFLKYNFNLEKY